MTTLLQDNDTSLKPTSRLHGFIAACESVYDIETLSKATAIQTTNLSKQLGYRNDHLQVNSC
jgi:hypothetical protein